MPLHLLSIVVAMPAHSQLAQVLTYAHDAVLPAGSLVRVPFGKREVLGIVWSDEASEPSAASAPEKIKAISAVLPDLAPLSATWRALVSFAARYYQRSLGEVAPRPNCAGNSARQN